MKLTGRIGNDLKHGTYVVSQGDGQTKLLMHVGSTIRRHYFADLAGNTFYEQKGNLRPVEGEPEKLERINEKRLGAQEL